MYQALEDALLQGRQLRILIEYTPEGKVDMTVDEGAWGIYSDLNFDSLEEALAATEAGVRKYYQAVEKLCA